MLEIRDLTVTYAGASDRPAVSSASLRVEAGQTTALVGESGSGKSSIALAVMGLLDPRSAKVSGRAVLRVESGETRYELGSRGGRDGDGLRRGRAGMVFQEPTLALHPTKRVGAQIAEALQLSQQAATASARDEAVELLRLVGIVHPERRADGFPHELSGGMAQRVMIAMALARDPAVLIADEPTTSLDATIEVQILDLIEDLQRRRQMGVLLISHDLVLVGRRAQYVYVCHQGKIVEDGSAEQVINSPRHDYTQSLVRDARQERSRKVTVHNRETGDQLLLEVKGLSVEYTGSGGTVRAVDGVNFVVERGQTLGLAGESGCGKSTLARAILRLVEPRSGRVIFDDQDVWAAKGEALRGLRRRMQMVFQNATGSLNPRMTVGRNVVEPLLAQGLIPRREWRSVARELLDRVGLPDEVIERRPAELSAGQRQRVAIARAIGPKPQLVICDEPVSSLDATVQARILDLLLQLQAQMNLSYVFISHDLRVVRRMADVVAVMYAGAIVETGPTEDLMTHPRHPYTMTLLAAAGVTQCRTSSGNAAESGTLIGVYRPQGAGIGGVYKAGEGNSDDSSCKDRGAG